MSAFFPGFVSDLDLRAELDDAVARDLVVVGGAAGVARHRHEQVRHRDQRVALAGCAPLLSDGTGDYQAQRRPASALALERISPSVEEDSRPLSSIATFCGLALPTTACATSFASRPR